MILLIAGDFCPLGEKEMRISDSLRNLFRHADFSFVNLECPLTECKDPIIKPTSVLRATPHQISALKELSCSHLTLASNHLRDYGDSGVHDTIQACVDNGFAYVGAGANIVEARKPIVLKRDGLSIGVINVTAKEFSIAGDRSPGANPLDLIFLLEDLGRLSANVDKVVVIVHGGLEDVSIPSPASVRTLRFIAEQPKVCAVIRHHPHVIQGWEEWKGVPIYYSLGNFYFANENARAAWRVGLVVELDIGTDGAVVAKNHFVRNESGLVDVIDRGTVDSGEPGYLDNACRVLGDMSQLKEQWKCVIERLRPAYMPLLYLPCRLLARLAFRTKIFRYVKFPTEARMMALNLFRCDTHNEIMQSIMEH